ncbi:MAG TPA: alpha/beta fold hydrolase [Terriglobales bacterium]|nr:alpha/beta fold hydrolase [Terriglobales bacterium]
MEAPSKTNPTQISDGRPCPCDFVPRWWIRGGHLQTFAANFLPRLNNLPSAEERLFSVEPDVQILTKCHWQENRRSRTTLVIVHGLEGSIESQYVIGTANKAWAVGMNVVRMNMRNCGGSERLARTLYNSSMSSDVAGVIKILISEDRLNSIGVAGFSMGGNLVLKMTGEWGTSAPLEVKAVVAISPAIDLGLSAYALHEWQNRIYEYGFLLGLYRSYGKKIRLYPDLYRPYPLFSIRTLRDFDDRITSRHGGFKDADDYYYRAASARVIDRIAVPTLIIHSVDDPFIRLSKETRTKILGNSSIRYIESPHGGHCAFIAEPVGYDGRWSEKKIVKFVREFSVSA